MRKRTVVLVVLAGAAALYLLSRNRYVRNAVLSLRRGELSCPSGMIPQDTGALIPGERCVVAGMR